MPREGVVQRLDYNDLQFEEVTHKQEPDHSTNAGATDTKTMLSIEKIQEKIRASQEILKKTPPKESNYYAEKLELLKSHTPKRIFEKGYDHFEKDLLQGAKENRENLL